MEVQTVLPERRAGGSGNPDHGELHPVWWLKRVPTCNTEVVAIAFPQSHLFRMGRACGSLEDNPTRFPGSSDQVHSRLYRSCALGNITLSILGNKTRRVLRRESNSCY